MTTKTNIGSFRDSEDYRCYLPKELDELLFGPLPDSLSSFSFDLNLNISNLNHAAFGSAHKLCSKAFLLLYKLSEEDPGLFYDKLIGPLHNNTLCIAKTFFNSEYVYLGPNLTITMKNILEGILLKRKKNEMKTILILEPIYGATRKLIKEYLPSVFDNINIVVVTPPSDIFEEDSDVFISLLNNEIKKHNSIDYLIADHVTSQSGRILPLKEIVLWCKEKNIISIIDGTQSVDLFIDTWPCYYILSTHKWLGNIKNCAIVRCEKGYENYPNPCGISFGYNNLIDNNNFDNSHKWTGMLNYIPYIVLSISLKIYQKFGKKIKEKSSNILYNNSKRIGLNSILPYYNKNKERIYRVINFIKINRFDDYTITDDNIILKSLLNNENNEKENNYLINYNNTLSISCLQDIFDKRNLRVSIKTINNERYIRLSSFIYNNENDFNIMNDILNYNINYQYINRETLIFEFLSIFNSYDALFSPLVDDGFFVRAEPLRHHLIFYYGHTAVFYINKLVLTGFISNDDRIDDLVESSCAVGVDEMSWDDLNEDNYPWTEESQKLIFIDKVKSYRMKLKQIICNLINNYDFKSKNNHFYQHDLPWIILMGIEHERIHIETSAVIIHQLQRSIDKQSKIEISPFININSIPKQFKICPYKRNNILDVPINSFIHIKGGKITMGRSDTENPLYFGWDNEFGCENASLDSFFVSKMLASNAEYLEFINDNGYNNKNYWNDESWKWVSGMKREYPLSWIIITNNDSKEYYLKTTFNTILMPWDWPVEVNHYEADAFCKWKSFKINKTVSLISHEEWYLLKSRSTCQNYNYNLSYGSPCPVDMFGEKLSKNSDNDDNINDIIYDISGNVWQHSRSVLTLLEKGFNTHPAYDDFTTPTIDGNHYFILGGSWISCGNPTHLEARYGFRKHFQQFTGIRYVISDNTYHDKIQPYYMGKEDCIPITNEYKEFTNNEISYLSEKPKYNWFSWFGNYCGDQILKYIINDNIIDKNNEKDNLNVMFINGGVGRTTIDFIKKYFSYSNNSDNNNNNNKLYKFLNILHSDLSATRLRVLENLIKCGMIRWDQYLEGDLVQNQYFSLTENNITIPKDKTKISYSQLDTNNINPKFYNRDVTIINCDTTSVITNPENIPFPKLVVYNGILILATKNKLESILGFECLSNNISTWKITRDTIRKNRIVKLYVSVWRRTNEDVKILLPLLGDGSSASSSSQLIHQNYITLYSDSPVSLKYFKEQNYEYYKLSNIIDNYENFHYNEKYNNILGVNNFCKVISDFSIEISKKYNISLNNALDVGCGPGRISIELNKYFKTVTAIDLSEIFINICKKYESKFEKPSSHNLNTIVGDINHFIENNKIETKYDFIIANNIIDRLSNPLLFLKHINSIINEDGIIIFTSPYTWQEEFTKKEYWIGGYQKWGENRSTIDGLKTELSSFGFKLLEEPKNLPFILPNSDGSFQYTITNVTIFGK